MSKAADAARPKRITVINDSIEFLDLARDILNDSGYTVTTYAGENLHLDGLRATNPDLVLLDLRLKSSNGELSGWEFLLLMRSDPALETVPIVVCTADAAGLQEHEADLRDVANAYVIRKPFDLPEFESTVAEALRDGKPAYEEGTLAFDA